MPAKLAEVGSETPLVRIVDDDADVRLALEELFASVGLDAVAYASPQELLRDDPAERPGCFILDVRMPGGSGLDLQRRLAEAGEDRAVIFLSGHADIEMSVQAMKAGAIDFLTKPVRDQTLLDTVATAIDCDRARRAAAQRANRWARLMETLTVREREVLGHVAQGRLNKQIAFDLGISEVTVKLHRSHAMRKVAANSVADLVRAWEAMPPRVRGDLARAA